MTVYLIKNADDKVVEVCANIGVAYSWIHNEFDESFRIIRYDDGIRAESDDGEVYVIIEWQVQTNCII